MINPHPQVAVIPAKGLGDALMTLIVAENLRRHGYRVSFYSNIAAQLQSWFPRVRLQTLAALAFVSVRRVLAAFYRLKTCKQPRDIIHEQEASCDNTWIS